MNNAELVTTAMTELFIDLDLTALDRHWAEDYTQHNPGITNGHTMVREMVANRAPNFAYQMGLVIAEGDFVAVHGRYVGYGPTPLIAVDLFKVVDAKIVEHWDVLQDEVPSAETASGNAMFPAG